MKPMKNMKSCGIAAEYNPFHTGHAYQIRQARQRTGCECVIAVMSGNFVQRGEPAVISKWARAEAAVQNGADLVLELPYVYATQSATGFARGAVKALALAQCDWMSFGSECGNLENLQEIADTCINPDHLHAALHQGMSFPRAYSLLTSEMEPNDILAVSYLKELKQTGITPVLIQRTASYLDENLSENASALAIRKALKEHRDLGRTTPMKEILEHSVPVWPEQYYAYARTYLLMSDPQSLSELFLFSEGIENHLRRQAKDHAAYEEFLSACTNYRYTAGRIRRCLLQAMNQVTKKEAYGLPAMDTLRVLAFNRTGRNYLHELRETGVSAASRFAKVPLPWRRLEYRTSLLYTSVMPEAQRQQVLTQEVGGAHFLETE